MKRRQKKRNPDFLKNPFRIKWEYVCPLCGECSGDYKERMGKGSYCREKYAALYPQLIKKYAPLHPPGFFVDPASSALEGSQQCADRAGISRQQFNYDVGSYHGFEFPVHLAVDFNAWGDIINLPSSLDTFFKSTYPPYRNQMKASHFQGKKDAKGVVSLGPDFKIEIEK